MHNEIIQAYLWREVINLAFCPVSEKDQKNWLWIYLKSLSKFWENDSLPNPPNFSNKNFSGNIDCHQTNKTTFDYLIKKKSEFDISFMQIQENGNAFIWSHHVDKGENDQYFSFPANKILECHNNKKKALKKVFGLKFVLEGLIFHPRAHQHIESPFDDHNIRIGGGIENAFLFLFHLRYQFCPIPEKREAEKSRLINLFQNAIDTGRQSVPPGELMAKS